MSLYTALQKAHTEEVVEDAYIKALDLKGHTKGLIDIQSKEIWFEAKYTAKATLHSRPRQSRMY